MSVRAVVFDIGNVLIRWDPEGFFDRVIGVEWREAFFAAVPVHAMTDRIDLGEGFGSVIDGVAPSELLFTDDRVENTEVAAARGWQTHVFEGPQAWADRLVAERLLTKDAAQ